MVQEKHLRGALLIPRKGAVSEVSIEAVAFGQLSQEGRLVVWGAAHPAMGHLLPCGNGGAARAKIGR